MNFEYDPYKSRANKEKHGIDFQEAQQLWESDHVSVSTYPGSDESREAYIGLIDEKVWVIITTRRAGNIRIISARRARKTEEDFYHDNIR